MLTVKNMGRAAAGKGSCRNLAKDSAAALEEDPKDRFHRVPLSAVVVAGPVLGLVYAAALPFIGIVMLLSIAVRRIVAGLTRSAYRGAVFTWKPGEACLAGTKGRARRTISKKEEEKKE
jgi:hypothetical protein